MPHLETHQLRKSYRSGQVSVEALRGVDLAVAAGEFVAIMGPSGSGKSTLLHLLGGLDRPTSGSVRLAGTSLSELDEGQLSLLRRRRIGVVFQFYNLLPTMTAEENAGLPLLLDGVPPEPASRRAAEALARVGLADRRGHTPDRLSGGEQQRVALARALVARPEVVLADEPTGNLDRAAGDQVLELFRRACDDGHTLVMVTHDDLAAAIADRVVFLTDGRVVDEMRAPDLTPETVAAVRARRAG
jgi:putative ABC transport system ATP-binding protein